MFYKISLSALSDNEAKASHTTGEVKAVHEPTASDSAGRLIPVLHKTTHILNLKKVKVKENM